MPKNKIEAAKFANTVRGQYILGQALYLAIQKLEAVPAPFTEMSNIMDMRFLMDNLFPIYRDTQEASKKLEEYRRSAECQK